MDRFKGFDHFEDRLTGILTLPDIGDIQVEFDLEDHKGIDDLNALMAHAESWLESFNKKILQDLKTAIAAELTDAAYTGSAYQPVSSDYTGLEQSLQLKTICFYIDAETSLIFGSETEYPDMDICCLVEEDFSIADVFLDANN
ncbi:hypothetical protein [Mucilaginibacter auburnensis]|uniref:DUF2262 domain-containing protein n=1 Tax=Mucilaginibacter auburnensis TaxID=1457233 RepID=A0A2H9VUC9_9SPHI|nr:hypothetical protein [Mucilaginibacter auburnensis]PJJ84436.1 hypothetical protein CLV57_1448 [Mucilaginibacter auburnensis]